MHAATVKCGLIHLATGTLREAKLGEELAALLATESLEANWKLTASYIAHDHEVRSGAKRT